MKYAIYDKAADEYLTKMEFDFDTPDNQMLTSTGYTEYIIDAQLLDTKESAIGVVTRIENCKFMEKGRFVIHSFDEKLADQYIISETGNPTKVVDSITVDLDGNINVKYGTMLTHWSSKFLEYAINRMNRLQEARSPKYSAWCNTFDIYKVIPVIDERSCGHYQFINVTTKGLEEYAKNEVDPLNKRIEELEKANYDLGEQVTARGIIANRLQEENDKLKAKVESIKKEVRDWKKLYEGVLEILSSIEDHVRNIIDDGVYWKNKAKKAEKDKDNQKKLNESFNTTIVRYRNKTMDMNKEIKELCTMRDCLASIMYAIRNAICDNNSGAFDCIESRMIHDSDFNSDTFMAGVRENILDICNACKKNIANNDLKNSEIARLTEKRDKALERAEFYRRMANSVYGISIPGRCCGKQMTADVITGKKILVDKKKYDDLVEYVANINLTYDNMFCMMDKPVYLSTITESLNDLTK